MANLLQGNPVTAHLACLCERCGGPLYSGQPMAVNACAARALRGCGHVCRPDESCSESLGTALHVGCALIADRAHAL